MRVFHTNRRPVDNLSASCLFFHYHNGNKAMYQGHQNLIDGLWLGRALPLREISDDDLASAVAAMSESWRTEIAARLGKLATDLQDLAVVAADAERRFLDATAACDSNRRSSA
jgi:hypothetical protein